MQSGATTRGTRAMVRFPLNGCRFSSHPNGLIHRSQPARDEASAIMRTRKAAPTASPASPADLRRWPTSCEVTAPTSEKDSATSPTPTPNNSAPNMG